jgi:hypothetical protein
MVTVPLYIVVAGYVAFFALASAVLTGFISGKLLSLRQHSENAQLLKDSRDEWKETAGTWRSAALELQGRSVVLSNQEAAAQVRQAFSGGGGG